MELNTFIPLQNSVDQKILESHQSFLDSNNINEKGTIISTIKEEPFNLYIIKLTIQSPILASYLHDQRWKNTYIQYINNSFSQIDELLAVYLAFMININIDNGNIIIEYKVGSINYNKIQKKHRLESLYDIGKIISEYTNLIWNSIESFRDIQTANLLFIRSYLFRTPYHSGPLDSESTIISEQIYDINRFDYITVSSQPYDQFNLNGRNIVQFPFIYGLYPRYKAKQLSDQLGKIGYQVEHINLKDGTYNSYNVKNNKFITAITDGIEESINVDNERMYKTGPKFFNDNKDLVINELDYIYVTNPEYNNQMFTDIVEVAKKLL